MSNAAQPDRPVLVTGATGNTGRALVDALTRRGAPVRAMVRSGADRGKLPAGVPAVVADFDDPESIAAALTGAERAYLVTPSSEQHVRDFGIPYTFLRPNLFFQGLLTVAGSIAAEGRLYAPIGDAKVSAVDVRDIAAVAAVALTEPGHEGATYTLTGPASITHAQMAAALTAALGRGVTFVDVPPEAVAGRLRGILPPWQVEGLLEDYAHYRRGEAAAVSPAVAEVTGRPPRDIQQFARDYAPAFTS